MLQDRQPGDDFIMSVPFGTLDQLMIRTRLLMSQSVDGHGYINSDNPKVEDAVKRFLSKAIATAQDHPHARPSDVIGDFTQQFIDRFRQEADVERVLVSLGA